MKVVLTFAMLAMFAASTTFAQCPSKAKKSDEKKDAKSESVENCSKCTCKDKDDSKSDK